MMKKLLFTAAAALMAVAAFSQEKITYSLPRTSFEFTVTAVRTDFTAGPYAAYASKYLGLDVRVADETTFDISEVKMRSFVEADPDARLTYVSDNNTIPAMLRLTSQGLVAGSASAFTANSGWKYPKTEKREFLVRPANLTSASGAVYTAGDRKVRQEVVVEKTDETKAAEVADRIFAIRKNKYNILVGDTDATYSGEAMKTAVEALDAMEAELLSLFTGSSSSSVQQAVFEVIPAEGAQDVVAFRLSPTDGLVPADDFAGTPYFVSIVPEKMTAPAEPEIQAVGKNKAKKPVQPKQMLHYRIPAICNVVLGDGVTILLRQRVPVYQLGSKEDYPIY